MREAAAVGRGGGGGGKAEKQMNSECNKNGPRTRRAPAAAVGPRPARGSRIMGVILLVHYRAPRRGSLGPWGGEGGGGGGGHGRLVDESNGRGA